MVTTETEFYDTPEEAAELMAGPELKRSMDRVTQFATQRGLVGEAPTLGYGAAGEANLRFDPTYVETMIDRGPPPEID